MNTRHKHVFVYFKLLFLISLFTNLVCSQGMPPTANTPGSPAGSYKLSDLDTINLFNGNLSLNVPLIKVGGRGEVAQGLSVNIENQWDVTGYHTIGDSILFEINPSYRSPLALVGHITSESESPTTLFHMEACAGGPTHWVQHQFNFKYVEPDGTEHMLVDPMYHGKPYIACTPFYNYGRVFESTSGEFMTFVTDADISSSSMIYSGYLYQPGGVTSRIVNGQIIWSEDRNGNKIQYIYNTGQYDSRLNTIIDANGRSVTIEYGVTDAAPYGVCDRITFKGGSGQNRIFRIKSDYLNNILRTTQAYDSGTIKTMAQLFPSENINYSLSNPNQEFDPWRVKSIFLPDGRSYNFRYNVYGRLARVELPTGGATEYDYGAPGYAANLEYYEGTVVGVGQEFVEHRVNEKRIYDGNNSLMSKTTFVKAASCPPQEPICPLSVDVDNYDASGNRINKARHYFSGWPDGLRSYETHWTNGREFKTEAYAADGTTLLRKLEFDWRQRIPTWCYNNPYIPNICSPDPSVGMPAFNSFMAGTTTTLVDTNQVSKTTSINPSTGEIGFDQYNNQTDVYEYDFGTGIPGALLRRTHIDFVTHPDYLNRQLFSLPSQTWISSDVVGNNRVALITYEYDNYTNDSRHASLTSRSNAVGHDTNYSTGFTIRGNVSGVTSYANAANQTGAVTMSTQYDILGNVVKIIDANGNASTIGYDDNFGAPDGNTTTTTPPSQLNGQSTFAFPTSVTNPIPFNWTAYTQYDYFTGAPVNAQDINGVVSKTIYNDLLDRPTQAVTAVGTALERQSNIIYDDANLRIETRTDLNALNDNLIKAESFYDGLGRTIESRKYEAGGGYVATQTQYDALGRPHKQSNPFRPSEINTNNPILWTQSYFDALGRVIKVKTPDNAEVTTSYSGNTVTVTDQALKERRSVTNALGALVRVDEPDASGALGTISSPNQPTYYAYDILNNLTTVSQGVQTRTFAYNSLSRLTSATNPESGPISYGYDNNGNLTSKTDARGVATTYIYDALNRVTNRNYSTPNGTPGTGMLANYQPSPNVTYSYDGTNVAGGIANSKGKLTKVSSSVSATEYTEFDILGRVRSHKQTTDGTGYTTGYSYNLSGALIEETYPSGRVVKNTLDVSGDLQQVQSRRANDTFRNHANSFTYAASGAVTAMRLGNGKWENTTFNGRLQPTQIGLGGSATNQSLLKLNYDYGTTQNNGNVRSQTITVPTVGANAGFTAVQTYTYDELNRLKSATENINGNQTPSWKQTYAFDRYGNRRFDEANTTTIPPGCAEAVCNPQIDPATNKLVGYQFDNAGNTKIDADGQAFTYDAENKQVKAQSDAQIVGEYSYDGDGLRIKKVVASTEETTVFVYDAAGRMVAEYSTQVASTSEAKVSYLTSDTVGSPRIITDAAGQVISRRDFRPYGEEITRPNYGQDSIREKFATYERDNETELDFAQARYYSSAFGRLSSVDPWGGARLNPQSLNRYVYVVNNPINFTDPLGLECNEANKADGDRCIWVSNGKLHESMWSSQFKKGNDLFDAGYTVVDPTTIQPFRLNAINNNDANPNNTTNLEPLRGELVIPQPDGNLYVYDPEVERLDSPDEIIDFQHPGDWWDAIQVNIGPVSLIRSSNYINGWPGKKYSGVQFGIGVPRFGISNVGGPGTTNNGVVVSGSACAIMCGAAASTLYGDTGFDPIGTFTPGFGQGTPQANVGLGLVLPDRFQHSEFPPHIKQQLGRYHPGYYRGTIPY